MDGPVQSVRVTVTSPGRSLATVVAVPSAAVGVATLVPVLHRINDTLVAAAEEAAGEHGREITCRADCPACCYQIVPVTEPEEHFLVRLVGSLPAARRESVCASVSETVHALESDGLLPALEHAEHLTRPEARALAIRYFRMQMPCPFLEDGLCSIYEQRPIACREFAVTSPREHCERFGETTVERVVLPVSLFSRLNRGAGTFGVPLVLALSRSGRQSGSGVLLRGPEHLACLLGTSTVRGGGAPRPRPE
jgi:Fe-S-cluster containining protein